MGDVLYHPTLGKIAGLVGDKVHQYLGVPYASLEHRFPTPQILSKYENGLLDATKLG
jgi:carboxylesterase type B